MTTLQDKADAANSDEVLLANESMGLYKLKSLELTPADDVTPEGEFPEYGDFAEVETSNGGRNPSWDETAFVEVPGSLAEMLVDRDVEPGDVFRILQVTKDASGEWVYELKTDDVEGPSDDS